MLIVKVSQVIRVRVLKNLERNVLLSKVVICSNLRIGAQEKETIQAKSNLRAIAAKVKRARFK